MTATSTLLGIIATWLPALAVLGCLQSELVPCEGGVLCPAGTRCVAGSCVDDGCGDGEVNEPEECEPGLTQLACNELPVPLDVFYSSTPAGCTNQCTFDVSVCREGGFCGDGVIDEVFETCDPAIAAGEENSRPTNETCVGYGFDAGRLGCTGQCTADTSPCIYLNLEPFPVGIATSTLAIAEVGTDETILVGDRGFLASFRDGFFRVWPWIRSEDQFSAVWAQDISRAIAIGRTIGASDNGLIALLDNDQWQAMSHPTVDGLRYIAGSNFDDVYAASESAILHFDGAAWTELAGVVPLSATVASLVVTSDGVPWLLLSDGSLRSRTGETWPADASAPPDLTGLSASGEELYAWTQTNVWRRSQGSWTNLGAPPLGMADIASARAIGDGFVFALLSTAVLYARYRGNWILLENDFFGSLGLTLAGKSRVWVVLGGTLLRNSHAWLANDGSQEPQIRDISEPRDDERLGVGPEGAILRYNGTWAEDRPAPDSMAGSARPLTVWLEAPGMGLAVGERSLVLEYTGGAWQTSFEAYPQGQDLHAVWSGGGEAFAVGAKGTILHRVADGEWSSMTSPTELNLNDVWGTAPDDVYAVGGNSTDQGGVLLHLGDDGLWAEVDLGTEPLLPLRAISGADGHVFIAGDSSLWHFDGTSWSEAQVNGNWHAVSAAAADDAFAVSDSTIMHFDGLVWEPVRGDSAYYQGVSADDTLTIITGSDSPSSLFRQRPWHR